MSRTDDVMTIRTSFELHADRCRVVEVHVASERGRVPADGVQVRSFITHFPDDPRSADFTASLRRLREEWRLARQATVTIWGLKSTHRFLRVAATSEDELPAQALREAADDIALFEADGTRARVAIAAGTDVSIGAHTRRDVSLTAASAADIDWRIAPLADAGFEIVRVITPAMALTAIARARVESVPGETAMYVALAPEATCVAIVRDGLLLLAREIQWGHASKEEHAEPFDRRLAAELRRSLLFFRQRFRSSAERLVLCGDIENLRSMSGTLGAVSGLPVEPLDSLSGIDATAVPEPAEEFCASVAALRLAIAAGAEAPPYSNLLPSSERATAHSRTRIVALAGGLAAALVLAGVWYGVRRSSGPPSTAARDTTSRQAATPPPAIDDPPREISPPREVPPRREAPPSPTADTTPSAPPPTSSAQPEQEVVVTSILYAADRKLAIVNGRIARPGDRIGSASIVEIHPHAIVVESPGRGRRIVSLRLPLSRAR